MHSDLVAACLDDAAEVSPLPFVELLHETDTNLALEERQLAALRILEQHAPELLVSLEPKLKKHDFKLIRQWIAEKKKREAADTIKADPGGYELVRISGGKFMIGSPKNEKNRFDEEGPQQWVQIADFYLGRHPVTNAQYAPFLEANPNVPVPEYWAFRQFNKPNQPVVGVSWRNAEQYAQWADIQLPSEAQWEYACRSGTKTCFFSGESEKHLDRVGWYDENSGGKLHQVGEKEASESGLYDMHGNVWEWVEDDWHENYNGAPNDGSAWIDSPRGSKRVIRGGSYLNTASFCRSASRLGDEPDFRNNRLGFRLALSLDQPGSANIRAES
jgi:formylglycine-generating enzyme required for sulfatase activity